MRRSVLIVAFVEQTLSGSGRRSSDKAGGSVKRAPVVLTLANARGDRNKLQALTDEGRHIGWVSAARGARSASTASTW